LLIALIIKKNKSATKPHKIVLLSTEVSYGRCSSLKNNETIKLEEKKTFQVFKIQKRIFFIDQVIW
jgi:hypothetical protein